jgi:hypothetical protein
MHTQRYSFDALRCGACRSVFYCDSSCQKRDWTSGGHRLVCVAAPQRPSPISGRQVLEEMARAPY